MNPTTPVVGDPVVVTPAVVTKAPINVVQVVGARLLVGEGPPNSSVVAGIGEEYLDVNTGILYKLFP